jgi:hypothetical protein
MPGRHNGRARSGGSAPRGSRSPRRVRTRRTSPRRRSAILVLLALALSAFVVPPGLASAAGEASLVEEEALAPGGAISAKQERAAARRARKEAIRETREAEKAQREARKAQSRRGPGGAREERENAVVHATCHQVSWTFRNFPDAPNNIVVAKIMIRAQTPQAIIESFTFDGPETMRSTTIAAPPGAYQLDTWAHWKTNGVKGGFDILHRVNCPAAPGFKIEKLQRITGGFTTNTLVGMVGQTVDYRMILTNTGNEPLTFGELLDTQCDEGTITGGPGSSPLPPLASSTFECSHVLGPNDQTAGLYANIATITGNPPDGGGPPITEESNRVVVTVPPPTGFTIEKLQRIAGSGGSFTTSTLTGQVGQTVEYEIVVKNTGAVALTLSGLTDSRCDPGTITGGPSGGILAAGASTSYLCSHLLNSGDKAAGSYSNTATLTGTPPEGQGPPISNSSNTVVVDVPSSGNSGNGSSSGSPPSSGVLTSVVNASKSGVLPFIASAVPRLKAPQGCVRNNFKAYVKSAGVESVTFYLDGHKLKTLTAKNSRKGLLTIEINPAKLKVGPHKLLAKITMAHPASVKATTASRKVTVVRCRAAVLTPKFTG